MNRLHQLSTLGQSVWIDFLSRDLIESGALGHVIADNAVVGDQLQPHHLREGARPRRRLQRTARRPRRRYPSASSTTLALRDVATACDVLRSVW
jgi:transaldolase